MGSPLLLLKPGPQRTAFKKFEFALLTNRRPKRPKSGSVKPLWLIAVVLIAAAGAAYWLWEKADKHPPQFESLLVSVNGEPRKLLHEETLKLHPRDRVRVLEVSTDALFNRGVRLASMGFDVNALRYQELPLSELLGEDGVFDFHSFLSANRTILYI